jgi:thiosulfate/3-mercaptopyruvate sulfurtransferase
MTGPLISPAQLLASMDDPDLVVVDCRWYLGDPDAGPAAYRTGHVEGAVYADLDTDLSGTHGGGRHPLPSPDEFDITLAELGIGPASTVVAYDDRGGAVAARLWWMLTDQGHQSSAVLDGGLQAWVGVGGRIETEPKPRRTPTAGAGVSLLPWRGVVSTPDVAARAGGVFDARAPERFMGETEPVDAKAGHIPGATNLPLTDHLDGTRFRDLPSMRTNLEGHGFGVDTIVHCGSGVTACHLILAAEAVGLPRPLLYVGSWSEWSSTDLPIATGSGT